MSTSIQKRMREHIVKTSYDLLKELDFSQITVQIICDKAEINRSTFYRYFEDKYALLYYIGKYIAGTLEKQVQLMDSGSIFEEVIYYAEANKKLFKNILASDGQMDMFNELVNIFSKIALENAHKFDDELSVNLQNAKYPTILSDFYSSGIIGVLKQWIDSKYHYDTEELVKSVNEGLGMKKSE